MNSSYRGKTLRVDLTSGVCTDWDTSAYFDEWLGGGGFAAKVLYDEVPRGIDPYDPENRLVFSAGVLIGTTAPGACKFTISTIGPMTGGWATSASDSHIGVQLKAAGYDNIVIHGRAEKPCYLWIGDDGAKLCDASELWGKKTDETLTALRKMHENRNLHALSIGPAGENLVRGACVIQDEHRAYGRCGIGAVMGSKQLKAVVCCATQQLQVAQPEAFMATTLRCRERMHKAPKTATLQKYGTLSAGHIKQGICAVPWKNFQEMIFPEGVLEKIEPTKTIDKYQVSRVSFPGCAICCGRMLKITDGPFEGMLCTACQCEALCSLQAKLGMDEPTFMFAANKLCNQLGVDIDFIAGTLSWAMECYQRGILTNEDTDNTPLLWGDYKTVMKLIEQIAHRKGFCDLLAEGSARAARKVGKGSEYYAIHLKGQELYEPLRASNGWALGAMTATRGGGHVSGAPCYEHYAVMTPEESERAKTMIGVDGIGDRFSYDNKAELVQYFEMFHRVCNSTGICYHNTIWNSLDFLTLEDMAEMLTYATGKSFDREKLMEITMRQLNMEKALNGIFAGFTRQDDMPDERELKEPIGEGEFAGWKFNEEKLEAMLDHYYELHGWNKESSWPTRETLESCGLGYVADELETCGRLG